MCFLNNITFEIEIEIDVSAVLVTAFIRRVSLISPEKSYSVFLCDSMRKPQGPGYSKAD